jgi:hypothetical protein
VPGHVYGDSTVHKKVVAGQVLRLCTEVRAMQRTMASPNEQAATWCKEACPSGKTRLCLVEQLCKGVEMQGWLYGVPVPTQESSAACSCLA